MTCNDWYAQKTPKAIGQHQNPDFKNYLIQGIYVSRDIFCRQDHNTER